MNVFLKKYPQTEEELEQGNKISKQDIFVCPGGAGMRVEKYLIIADFSDLNQED